MLIKAIHHELRGLGYKMNSVGRGRGDGSGRQTGKAKQHEEQEVGENLSPE